MKRIFLIIIFGLIFSLSSFAQSSADDKKAVGELSGLVFNEIESLHAIVPEMKIIIEGKNFRRIIEANGVGYYEIWLPKGKYTSRVPKEGDWSGSARKQVFIIPGKSFTHNFILKRVRTDAAHP